MLKKKIVEKAEVCKPDIAKKEIVVAILKAKVSKLFDREPVGYSEERLSQLAEEIINAL